MRTILLPLLLLATASPGVAPASDPSVAQPAADGRAFVGEFLAIVERRSLFSTGPAWPAIRARAIARAQDSTDALSTYPILESVINELGDEHGGLRVTDARTAEYRRRYGRLWYELTSPPPRSSFTNRGAIVADDFPVAGGSVRGIIVPHVFTSEDEQAYAGRLSEAIAQAPAGTCGYLLDLRGNVGGDMWPMLAGLSPLLGDGVVGAFSSRGDPSRWRLAQGKAGDGSADDFVLRGWRASSPAIGNMPVALLLDDGVLSSGEAVAVAFHGRARTRSFGARTYGLSTANSPFPLSDGSTLFIATGVYVDRLGNQFPHGVEPDEIVDPVGDRGPAFVAARQWLERACGATPH